MSAVRKILVVDDDPVVGTSFNRVLRDKGYTVITAGSGSEALAKLQQEHPDVVFTDIRMPGMDGLEVAERVKARQPWTPVVIVTGYGSADNEQRAREAGVSQFLRKPLSPEMIEQSAERAFEQGIAPQPEPATATRPEAKPEPEPEAALPELAQPAVALSPARPRLLKNMALFLMAPFVGLAYAVLLPFVGIGMLAWVVAEPLLDKPAVRDAIGFMKFAAGLLAAPFIGLAYVLLAPVVGVSVGLWSIFKAIVGRSVAE